MEVGAMQREVAMREGEARRFADGRHNRAPLYLSGWVCDRAPKDLEGSKQSAGSTLHGME
jgi:hypothetical protein